MRQAREEVERAAASIRAALAALVLVAAGAAEAEVTVTSERRGSAYPTDGTFVFNTVPSNTSEDIANGKLFTVLAGTPHASGPISNLTNGPAQTNGDSVAESFFEGGTGTIRVQIDLGAVFTIEQINSYSWHANTRAPQIYKVYGAVAPVNSTPDFAAAAFQNDAALGTLGYELIATVSTPMTSGGQVGVSIAGEIGDHRFLLFDMAPPVWGVGPRPTFFGEIDILGVPAAAAFRLTVTPAAGPAAGYDLEWESQPGKLYNLRTSTDLAAPIAEWDLVAGDIPSSGSGTNTWNVKPPEPRRFYAVEEYPAPPVVVFSESFDTTAAGVLPPGWTTGKNNPPDTASLTYWELGTPANVGPVPPGAPLPSGPHCLGTNIAGNYDDPSSDTGGPYTDIWLRTPPIDLSGRTSGTLTLRQWTEIEQVSCDLDYGSIVIRDADDPGGAPLALLEDRTIDGISNGWSEYSEPLPAEAFNASNGRIVIEFRFEADDIDSFAGWYIDDVVVTVPAS